MRRTIPVLMASLLLAPAALDGAQGAEVVISVNKATQTMSVLIDGAEAYNWTVSTGVGGGPYDGTYKPGRMERKWASRKYGMAPMPYSIFFDGNYAIHGTVKVSQLGRRASKGCVRLHPRDAAVLFELVGREKANTTIVVDKTTHVAARVPSTVRSDAPAIGVPAAKSDQVTTGSIMAEPQRQTTAAADATIRPKADVPKKRKVRTTVTRTTVTRISTRQRTHYSGWFR